VLYDDRVDVGGLEIGGVGQRIEPLDRHRSGCTPTHVESRSCRSGYSDALDLGHFVAQQRVAVHDDQWWRTAVL
jgi:hypothetical protein